MLTSVHAPSDSIFRNHQGSFRTAAHGIFAERPLARYLVEPRPEHFRFHFRMPHGKASLGSTADESADLALLTLSHSHDLALFAFALGREVGVDVEHIRVTVASSGEGLAERFFSSSGGRRFCAPFRRMPRMTPFFNCWTRKEAYVQGPRCKGLSIDLASFAVSLEPSQMTNVPIIGIDDPEAAGWSLPFHGCWR